MNCKIISNDIDIESCVQLTLFSIMYDAKSVLDEWLAQRPEMYRRQINTTKPECEIIKKTLPAGYYGMLAIPGIGRARRKRKRHFQPKTN